MHSITSQKGLSLFQIHHFFPPLKVNKYISWKQQRKDKKSKPIQKKLLQGNLLEHLEIRC